MASESNNKRIVGLDIGTSKVAAIVGEVTPEGELEVIGIGSHPSRGLKKGVVVNIESTVQSIQRAVEEAELMAGSNIDVVYAGNSRQSCQEHQFPRHCRHTRPRGVSAGRRARHRCGAGSCHTGRSEGPAHHSAGVPDRQPGRRQGTAGDVRSAPRSQGASGYLRRERRPEHREVHRTLWSGCAGHYPRAGCVESCGAL